MVECLHALLYAERHDRNFRSRGKYEKFNPQVSVAIDTFARIVLLILLNLLLCCRESAVPRPIWNSVRRSNIAFSHNQDQFSLEHFNFMKKLCCMRLQVLPGSQNAVWV